MKSHVRPEPQQITADVTIVRSQWGPPTYSTCDGLTRSAHCNRTTLVTPAVEIAMLGRTVVSLVLTTRGTSDVFCN
jgi:hypothetical protein